MSRLEAKLWAFLALAVGSILLIVWYLSTKAGL